MIFIGTKTTFEKIGKQKICIFEQERFYIYNKNICKMYILADIK